MIRSSARLAGAAALAVLFHRRSRMPSRRTRSCRACPGASAAGCSTRSSGSCQFPKPDPADFTADGAHQGSCQRVSCRPSWGYDENRIWQIQAILKTPVEGISKVIVFIGDKTGKQQALSPRVLYHCPTASTSSPATRLLPSANIPMRTIAPMLQQRANGPYRGAAVQGSGTGRVRRLPMPALQRGAGQHG